MPQAVLEIVGAPPRLDALPLELTQRASPSSTLARVALLLPALLLVLIPAGSLLLVSAPALAYASSHPADAVLAASGVTAFLALFGLPFARALAHIGSVRNVRIAGATVTVVDRSVFGRRAWELPLASYCGIAHVVRTTLMGTRHELVLVHPLRAHQILLCAADKISESELAHAARSLRLPAIAASDLYAWPRLARVRRPVVISQPAPVAQAA